jgi:thioesterase domain-containing protein/acyl carrier protein
LLDIATGYAMDLIEGYGEGASLYVPLSYKSVRIRGPLPARLWSHVRGAPENHRDKEVAHFDVTLVDDSGRVVLEVERFTIRRIDAAKGFAAATHSAPSAPASEPGAHLSPAERAFRRTLAAGILPEEGVAVLERVLAAQPEPQVIATSIELGALVAQVREAVPAAPSGGAKFSRPSLATEYKAPSDELESALVEMFAELLGVEQVGVQDDFFELGGHSLIAVRLFAQVKKRFEVDYPISVLFEAPTAEKLAALLRSELGGDATGAAIEKPAFRFLVPMHAGDVGAASAPFFLVAGMFGNVLNLRHLASLVGRERRFYAIQAQGLRGDEQPHRTFEEMAAAYLAELRAVQPHGPYFLGGFSGGGITAFEMAQQLRAAGEEVALLVFLDTPTPQPPDRLTARDKIVIHAQRLWREGPRYFTNWARARIAWELAKRRPQPDASSAPYEFRSKVIEAAFYGALRVYETRPFAGRAVLFRPALDLSHPLGGGRVVSSQREFVYADNAWSPYIRGGVEVHEVPGDHDGMVLEPNVRVLAAKLRVSLEEAEARARGGAS